MFSILAPLTGLPPLHLSPLAALSPPLARSLCLAFFVSFLYLCVFSFSLSLPFRSVTAAGEMYSESKWNFR